MTKTECCAIMKPHQIIKRASKVPETGFFGIIRNRLSPVIVIGNQSYDGRSASSVYPDNDNKLSETAWSMDLEDEVANDWEIWELRKVEIE